MNKETEHWVINIVGYGAFLFFGNEAEAEEMRAHKARWERGIGKKRRATDDEVATGKADSCLNHPLYGNRFIYSDCQCSNELCLIEAAERTP